MVAAPSSTSALIIPPIPPPGMAGASFFFGVSPTMASVVIIRPAIDAASCSATRTTTVRGSYGLIVICSP